MNGDGESSEDGIMEKIRILNKIVSGGRTKYTVARNGVSTGASEENIWFYHVNGLLDESKIKIYRHRNGKVIVASKNRADYEIPVEERGRDYEIKKKRSENNSHGANRIVVSDVELRSRIDEVSRFINRPELTVLKAMVISKNTEKYATTIIGLRRTGKTVLMLHLALEARANYKRPAFISCGIGTSMDEVEEATEILINKGYNLILLDEITWCDDFAVRCRRYVERFGSKEVRIVMTGTDSFKLVTARMDQLLLMTNNVYTSPLKYGDYRKIKGGKVLDYINSGGILSSLDDKEDIETYLNSAVIDNICNTLSSINGSTRTWKGLCELNERGVLRNIVLSILLRGNEERAHVALRRAFEDPNLALALRNTGIKKYLNMSETSILHEGISKVIKYNTGNDQELRNLKKREIAYVVQALLCIKAVDLCKTIEVYDSGKEDRYEVIYHLNFTQFGLRMESAKRSILGTFLNYVKTGITSEDMGQIEKKINEQVEGTVIEDVIVYHLGLKYGKDNVYKCRFNDMKEVDIVVQGSEGKTLIEVKRTDRVMIQKPKTDGKRNDQIKWLVDKEVNDWVSDKYGHGEIISRKVVYTGRSMKLGKEETYSEYEVEYVNLDEFMDGIIERQ